MGRYKLLHLIVTAAATASLMFFFMQSGCHDLDADSNIGKMVQKQPHVLYDERNVEYEYSRDMPLIFIGGMPRSGTTLMRAMIDAHADVRCGEETRVIPRLLGMRAQWEKSPKEHARLQEAGLTGSVIDDAISAFILEVIAKHGSPAPRLCNKDPFVLRSTKYVHKIFPNSKFLLMIRDGRATVHSIISRKVTISGFDIKSYRDCLKKWNLAIESMYNQCLEVGPQWCKPVFYEQLVLHPEEWLKSIVEFLDLEWDSAVLHHQDYIGKEISLSKRERSTDQVVKPVNMEGLTKWVGQIPPDVVRDMPDLAPMLQKLGYDPRANPPNYGNPDSFVLKNEQFIKENKAELDKRVKEVFGDNGVDLENNPAADENHPLLKLNDEKARPRPPVDRGGREMDGDRRMERGGENGRQGETLMKGLKQKMNRRPTRQRPEAPLR
ncbi:Protein-tyrosine sulfotransferase 2 [Holothuria leucospilota]|uniref:Protein-tyrosine sulfotransferase n=1 Tax=Holothuria leucospilota TaxID=206669 RepID=A0A9Q1CEW9_HOLLE|nr:Protein-tyrosine sulfotransferase 2 [Holothuria leucospilota]